MSKGTVALLGSVLALAVGAAPAGAASDNHASPGTPETDNCSGQTVSYIAQLGAEAEVHGLGGVASAFGFSVEDIHALIDNYCAS